MLLVLVNNDDWAFTANKIILGRMTGNLSCITPEKKYYFDLRKDTCSE